jgi:hypothetical protein
MIPNKEPDKKSDKKPDKNLKKHADIKPQNHQAGMTG